MRCPHESAPRPSYYLEELVLPGKSPTITIPAGALIGGVTARTFGESNHPSGFRIALDGLISEASYFLNGWSFARLDYLHRALEETAIELRRDAVTHPGGIIVTIHFLEAIA